VAETKRNVLSWQSLTRSPNKTASEFWRLVNLAIHCKCAQCTPWYLMYIQYCRARARYSTVCCNLEQVCCGLSRLLILVSGFQFGHKTKNAWHSTICNCELGLSAEPTDGPTPNWPTFPGWQVILTIKRGRRG
jgi:hypothetical protein